MNRELLCIECRLNACDDTSFECAYRAAGKLMTIKARNRRLTAAIKATEATLARLKASRGDRKEYHRNYYQVHRPKKLAAAKARNSRNHAERDADRVESGVWLK